MQTYFSILILTLIGGVTAYLARERGRDPIIWFVIGVLFSVFGLIALLLLPDLSVKSSDQNELKISPEGIVPLQQDTPAIPSLDPELAQGQWFYMDRNWQVTGPLLLVELADRWNKGEIPVETYVWNPSLPEWVPPYSLDALMLFLNRR